jgi:hypothetical protein
MEENMHFKCDPVSTNPASGTPEPFERSIGHGLRLSPLPAEQSGGDVKSHSEQAGIA